MHMCAKYCGYMLGYTVLAMTHIQNPKILIEKQVFSKNNLPLKVDLKLIENFMLFEDRVPWRTSGVSFMNLRCTRHMDF